MRNINVINFFYNNLQLIVFKISTVLQLYIKSGWQDTGN